MNVKSDSEIELGNFAPRDRVLWLKRPIRVVDWNIDRGLRLSSIIDFLSGINADLILLQDADLNAKRTHRLNIAREIAQKLQLNYIFGREFEEMTQGSRTSPAYHGQATLSPWPLSNSRILRFQTQSNFWRPRWFIPEIQPFQERIGGRLALVCDVCLTRQTTLVTYNLHLESRGNDNLRCSQLEECFDDARQYKLDTALILAGDLNLDVSQSVAATGSIKRAQFHSALPQRRVRTTPASSLFDRGHVIDWVFTRGPLRALGLQVHSEISASDHYPLSVELTFT